MLISVFTPTNNTKYLARVYECLKNQTFTDWEWVVVPNGPSSTSIAEYVMTLVGNDARVRNYIYVGKYPIKIGALKKFACDQCRGQLFLELDHDDMLTDDCLADVAAAAEKAGPDAFIYSDDVTATSDNVSHVYSQEFGWTYRDWEYNGIKYTVNNMFEITPRSLCEIFYAPDHVRVWTKEAYKKSGGHDVNLRVGDDHALMVRTYLAGTEFVRIPKVLYIHRLDTDNTSAKSYEEIAAVSQRTRNNYLHALVAEWCRRHDLPMLDLGGAHNCPTGYTPVDVNLPKPADGKPILDFVNGISVDVFELDKILPDNSIGCFRAHDFLEHVPIGKVTQLMNMLYRKLLPGGYLLTHTPAVCDNEGRCGRGAYQDPTHCSFWSSNNTWYFSDRNYAKYVTDIACRFQSIVLENYYPSTFHHTHLIPYLRWDAMALKGDDDNRYPGLKKI